MNTTILRKLYTEKRTLFV